MTRADIERRLADAFELSPDRAKRILVYLTALAREPGGAEAVAAVMDLRAVWLLDCPDGDDDCAALHHQRIGIVAAEKERGTWPDAATVTA